MKTQNNISKNSFFLKKKKKKSVKEVTKSMTSVIIEWLKRIHMIGFN